LFFINYQESFLFFEYFSCLNGREFQWFYYYCGLIVPECSEGLYDFQVDVSHSCAAANEA
jgi:hypothetical protein